MAILYEVKDNLGAQEAGEETFARRRPLRKQLAEPHCQREKQPDTDSSWYMESSYIITCLP